MTGRIYIGIGPTGDREIFRCASVPSHELLEGVYVSAIGPFQTRRGAKFMRDHGRSNPHCLSVADAERLAKRHVSTTQAQPLADPDGLPCTEHPGCGCVVHCCE